MRFCSIADTSLWFGDAESWNPNVVNVAVFNFPQKPPLSLYLSPYTNVMSMYTFFLSLYKGIVKGKTFSFFCFSVPFF